MNTNSDDENTIEWKIDFDALPGPERSELLYFNDDVCPAATKDLVAVSYSIVEWRMMEYGGAFALFEGPPDSPKLLWCPEGLQCEGYQNVIKWLDDDRYVVMNGYMYDRKKNVEIPFIFVDVEQQQIAYFRMINSFNAAIESTEAGWIIREREKDSQFPSRDGERIDPETLHWLPWSRVDELKTHYWQEVKGPEKPGWFRRLIGMILGNRG